MQSQGMKALLTGILALIFLSSGVSADDITLETENAGPRTIKGRIIGEMPGGKLIERADGEYLLVDSASVLNVVAGDYERITPREMGEKVKAVGKGDQVVSVQVTGNVVVGLVLQGPVQKRYEGAVNVFLKKATKFMENMDGLFEKYASKMGMPLRPLEFPMVMLIFESDEDFNDYYSSGSGGNPLSADGVLGFYSGTTNWLAVRMRCCDTFEVPIHEGVHQQMANRVYHRYSSIPRWFSEGIANSFEGNGDRIDSNPSKVNPTYVKRAQRIGSGVSWSEMMGDDQAFFADVVAGDAYTLAWCLHWTIWTQFEDQYKEYIKILSERKPLEKIPDGVEEALVERVFGTGLEGIKAKFPAAILEAAKRQRVNLFEETEKTVEQQAMVMYRINGTIDPTKPGGLRINGKVKNMCPFRDMTAYVTVETDGGMYFGYLMSDLKPRVEVTLPANRIPNQMPGVPLQQPRTYRIFVRAVPSDSKTAEAWKSGRLPVPFTFEAMLKEKARQQSSGAAGGNN